MSTSLPFVTRHVAVLVARHKLCSLCRHRARWLAIVLILLAPSLALARGGAGGGGAGRSAGAARASGGAARASGWSGGGASRSAWSGGGGTTRSNWGGGGLQSGGNAGGANRVGAGQGLGSLQSKAWGQGLGQGAAGGQLHPAGHKSLTNNKLGSGLSNGQALRLQTGAGGLTGKSTPRATTRQATWHKASSAQLQQFRTSLNRAVLSKSNAAGSTHHGMSNWLQSHPQLATALSAHAHQVRANWAASPAHCFHGGWWVGRPLVGWRLAGWPAWGYRPWLGYRPWWYWWGFPGWRLVAGWVVGWGWNDGYYYDYGPDGNVVTQNGQVAVNGEVVGTAEEYSQSAAELAAVDPADLTAVAAEDWMALGTFSMAVTQDEVDPARVVQLALSKNGLVSGTIFNRQSGNTYTVQGRVDQETQRLAFTIGEDASTVLETGIYNLTQDESPVLCHFGSGQTQVYLLARLPMPEHEEETTDAPATPAELPAEASASNAAASALAPAAEVSAK